MIDNNFSNNFPPNTDPRFLSPLPPSQPSVSTAQSITSTESNQLPPLPQTPLPPQNLNQQYSQAQSIAAPAQPIPTGDSSNIQPLSSFAHPNPVQFSAQPLPIDNGNNIVNQITAQQNSQQPKKSKLKMIIMGILATLSVIFGTLVVLDKVAGQGIKDAGECFASELKKEDETTRKMKATESQAERRDIFCKDDEESLNRLISCLENVKSNHSLSGSILEAFPKYKNSLEDSVTSHNRTCPNSPISLP